MASENILTLDTENFDSAVSQGVILVDFWATWCSPCRMIAPILEQLADDYDGRVKIGKVDVDQQSALAERFTVMSIPTLILFKDGNPVDKVIGVTPKAALSKMLDTALA